MDLRELREHWLRLAEEMSASVMGKYYAQRQEKGPAGREGLGIYGIYQERVARRKVNIAVKLLQQNGSDPTISNIHKLTGQSRYTIEHYLPKRLRESQAAQFRAQSGKEPGKVIPLRRPSRI